MKKFIRYLVTVSVCVAAIWKLGIGIGGLTALAWGDSDGGRPEYTNDEINHGALGPAGSDAADQEGYPGTIVFNSIYDSVIGREYNFVGAREDTGVNDGEKNVWNGNEITAEDGKTYLIRLFVHNNNPNGEDAVAEDVRVAFNIPTASSRTVRVNGFINSSNATPSEYWDYVNFVSDTPFHLEYLNGSALLENNGIGAGGLQLSDEIVTAEGSKNGVLIGYKELDGRIPGCYQYSSYITVRVRVVYDYAFSVESTVRLVDDNDDGWHTTMEARPGDILNFQITYRNTDEFTQSDVVVAAALPAGLSYVKGSTMLYDMSKENINGSPIEDIITDTGEEICIGSYAPGAYARVCFNAKVDRWNLADGQNTLVSAARVRVNQLTLQSHTKVEVYSVEMLKCIVGAAIVLFVVVVLYRAFFKEYITTNQQKKS